MQIKVAKTALLTQIQMKYKRNMANHTTQR